MRGGAVPQGALRLANSPDNVMEVRRNKVLKADLKRSTAAVRKAKNISAETLQQLSSDILSVNLARHVQEVGARPWETHGSTPQPAWSHVAWHAVAKLQPPPHTHTHPRMQTPHTRAHQGIVINQSCVGLCPGQVASALIDDKLKATDVPSAVSVCSLMHQR
jgi:hypothetical protein